MILIIDGNNLIGGYRTNRTNWSAVRKDLVLKLVKYVGVTGRKVKIVFDGVEDTLYPEGIIFKGVQIFYARVGKDADERIKSMVRNASYIRDITVVSSDRELTSCVSGLGAKVMTRETFRCELSTLRYREGKNLKESDLKAEDISEWLTFFGINENDDFKKGPFKK